MIHIALTTGEPAGIGPEISFKAAQEFLKKNNDVVIHLLGDSSFFGQTQIPNLKIVHHALRAPVKAGQLDIRNAPYVLSTLDTAIDGCLSHQYHAIVTAPIQKSVISESGISFTGHTEYLAQKCNVPLVVMMLCGKPVFESTMLPAQIRVALATTHIPLQQVPKMLTTELLVNILEIMNKDLQEKFAISKPVIYVAGLNPHAGESGHIGLEEQQIIEPAIAAMANKSCLVEGPFAGDTIFNSKNLNKADAILAMYHDQGLAPFKFATFGKGVNVTLGLPIIRTSVDHGTALSIAGKGIADVSSMLAALSLAKELVEKSRGASSS
jgi:4-hydroxythreonine-4-phosphate dehydrogenase